MAVHEFDFEKEPTVSVVKRILNDAIKMRATDVHFDPTEDELVVKFRVNGNLIEYTKAPENVKANITTRVKILAGMNITEASLPQVGTINMDTDSKSHTMRVSSLPVADGEKIVAHITNYSNSVKSIAKLGFSDEDVKKIKDMLKEQDGIILVTGNANSGKTTTIYSMLKEFNSSDYNIISIEEPIAMKMKGINQVEICPEKGITYRNILKNVLLQDPNIIAISELVDDETARFALRTAISGRLVISSLPSKTIYRTIENLIRMDVENYLLGSSLKGIISQRLVKRLCPMCREKKKATDYEKKVIKEITGKDISELYYPSGCEDCKDGYIGVIPVAEVIKLDAELRHAISNGKSLDLIRSIIYEENKSILKDGFNKVINGDTSFEEIIRIMDLDEDFKDNEQDIKDFILGKDIIKQANIVEESDTSDIDVKIAESDIDEHDIDFDDETNVEADEDSYVDVDDEANNEDLDAVKQVTDAKDLLNKLMDKSKKDKKNKNDTSLNKDKENKSEESATDSGMKEDSPSEGVKSSKSQFNANDIDVDDDEDDFDYTGYENNF